MTDTYDDYELDPDADEVPAAPRKTIHEVFNPEGTVGVACDRDGEVVGMHITDEARENGDVWLAAEIVNLAKLAHMQSRVGLRREMEAKGTRPYTIDSFGLPTEAAYRSLENEIFGTRAQ
ncbi:hypothetical protein [Nocardia sp. NPDC051750]|uniref:hypothetical protein n=1 Tax=Nocardia sp. NPDC051750 TaxID=3364325 RepID=UPI003787363A